MSCAVSLQVGPKPVPFEAREDFVRQFGVDAFVEVSCPGGLASADARQFSVTMTNLMHIIPPPVDGIQHESVTIFFHYLFDKEPKEMLDAGPGNWRADPRIESLVQAVLRVYRELGNNAIHYVGAVHYTAKGPRNNIVWRSLYVVDSHDDYGVVPAEVFYSQLRS